MFWINYGFYKVECVVETPTIFLDDVFSVVLIGGSHEYDVEVKSSDVAY